MDSPSTNAPRKRKTEHVDGSLPRRRHLDALVSYTSPVTRAVAKYPGLCGRCSRLGLDTIFTSQHVGGRSEFVATLNAVSAWSTSSCPFCRLLSKAFGLETFQKYKPDLVSYSSNQRSHLGWSSIENQTLLTLSGRTTYLVRQAIDEKGPIRRLKHDEIDFSILKSWIAMCQRLHTENCVAADSLATTVPFFKLIECETRKIVPGPNKPFVALSYLWGTVKPPKSAVLGNLPESLPRTMEDSIIATLKLGFQYLWIDAYCIDQDREEEKAAQIPRMDLIYQNATITIIACAGNDSDYGLPGVGLRHRKLQPEAVVGNHLIISTLGDPRTFVTESKWNTRAWTYQEGILSQRRLVFTNEQVYFECNGMYCCESMDLPLQDLHTKSHQSFKRIFCQGDGIGCFPLARGRTALEVIDRIEEYSERSLKLTEPSDILKGILGILNAFSGGKLRLLHHGGIPVLPPSHQLESTLRDIWTPSMGFCSGLCWTLKTHSIRKPEFPSWSWTGWASPVVSWGYHKFERGEIKVDRDVNILVQTSTGQFAELLSSSFLQTEIKPTASLTNVIQITAWVSSMRIKQHEHWSRGSNEYETKLLVEDGGWIDWTFTPTSTSKVLPEQDVFGIHVAYKTESSTHGEATAAALLVVCKAGAIYERLGFGWVSQGPRFDKAGRGVSCSDDDGDNEDYWVPPDRLRPLDLVRSLKVLTLG